MNDIFEWQDDHHKALEGWRRFNRIFTKRVVEPKPDPPADGVVYLGGRKMLTRNATFKLIDKVELPTKLTADEVRESLYPRRRK